MTPKPLSTNYADRHTSTFIDPQPLPTRGDLVTVHIISYEQPVSMLVLAVVANSAPAISATHTIFLKHNRKIYAARYYSGAIAGLGRATPATSHEIPTPIFQQLGKWRGSSQLHAALRRWLAAAPA